MEEFEKVETADEDFVAGAAPPVPRSKRVSHKPNLSLDTGFFLKCSEGVDMRRQGTSKNGRLP